MTLERLLNCIHFNSKSNPDQPQRWIPERPEGISEARWKGMVKAAIKLYEEEAK